MGKKGKTESGFTFGPQQIEIIQDKKTTINFGRNGLNGFNNSGNKRGDCVDKR